MSKKIKQKRTRKPISNRLESFLEIQKKIKRLKSENESKKKVEGPILYQY